MKTKIGNTPLTEISDLSKKFHVEQVYIKDESHNPTGTWKDRRSLLVLKEAKQKNAEVVALISSGNTCNSLSTVLPKNIEISCVIDIATSKKIKKILRASRVFLLESDLSKKILHTEDIIKLVRKDPKKFIIDATNGYSKAYIGLVSELRRVNPTYIFCPFGSGEAFVGIHRGIKKYKLSSTLIGVSPKKLRDSLADKLTTPWHPYSKEVKKITQRKHVIFQVSEKEIKEANDQMKKYTSCEPSGSIGLAGLKHINFKPTDTIVVINSGAGIW